MPVAGADRLMLTEHIAVMDLMALADALLLPDDDLALASVLKSPLFGLDDEQLFALAGSARARCAPRCAQSGRDDSRQRHDALDAFALRAQERRSPSTRACSAPSGGRERFLARLGPKPTDALDEFLNLALDYERARRRRCRASSPGCVRRRPRSSATWRWRATKCG